MNGIKMPLKFLSGIYQIYKTGFLGFNFFQLSVPNFFALYPFNQVHKTYKQEKERTGKTKQGNIFCTIKFIHRPAQPF